MNYLSIILYYKSSSDEMWARIVVGIVSFICIYGVIKIINWAKSHKNKSINSSKVIQTQETNQYLKSPAEIAKSADVIDNPSPPPPLQNQKIITDADDQIKILKELLDKGIITSTEFEEKQVKIQEKITNEKINIELKKRQEIIDDRIKKKSQPLIELVHKANQSRLISDEECNIKVAEIIEKTTNDVLRQLSNINSSLYDTLPPHKQEKVNICLATIEDSDTIVLHRNKIKVFNQQDWDEIIKDDLFDNFQILYQNEIIANKDHKGE